LELKYKYLLVTLLVVVAIASIIILKTILETPIVTTGEVTLYMGSKPLYAINIDENICRDLIKDIRDSYGIGSRQAIIMFGLTTCPHCKIQDKLFTEYYGSIYKPLWIDVDSKAYNIFYKLVDLELKGGARPADVTGVPHTVVISEYTIKAIIVGRVDDIKFWDDILREP